MTIGPIGRPRLSIMFRMPSDLRAGISAALLWLGSGVAFAVIVWFGLYQGDFVRLLVPETIRVGTWQLGGAWPVLIPLASSLAFGGATAWGTGLLRTGAAGIPRRVQLLATWMIVVLSGAATGAATGIGTLIGNGPPPRLAFIVQGLPDAIALGLAAGLLIGWIPAWVSLPPRTPPTGAPRGIRSLAPAVPGVTAATAALALIVATAIVVADARQAGLAGIVPPSVQQPQADPAPTGTPPPPVAPGDHPSDPIWCSPGQLLLQAGGADAATGHRSARLVATNTGAEPCVLPGYPDIAFADEHGAAVDAAVRYGGGFMTEDPGPAAFELQAGAAAVALLAWDATDGRSTLNQVFVAPYPGATRTLTFVDPPFDITPQTEVSVTAWTPGGTAGPAEPQP